MVSSLKIDFNVPAEMRDGTILNANIFRPADDGEYPIALSRTPYGKDYVTGFPYLDPVRLALTGYIVVVQDVRGRGSSQGEWELFSHEAEDGYDTVEWSAALPGSNGNVGMWGFSYLGFTQWTAAMLQPPHLKAIMPAFTWADARNGMFWRGGALELGLLVNLLLPSLGLETIFKRFAGSPAELGKAIGKFIYEVDHQKDSGLFSLPLKELRPIMETDLGVDVLADLIDNPAGDKYGRLPYAIREAYDRVQVPAYNIAGWYDIFSQETMRNYSDRLKDVSAPSASQSKLIIGPWAHLNYSNVIGEADFGMASSMTFIDAQMDHVALTQRWFDFWLKGIDNGIMDEPPVKVFITGANEWRGEQEWPPARAVSTPYYLQKGGSLSSEPPVEDDASTGYIYDPADPTPTSGGALLMHPAFQAGVKDQREIEARADVLSFSSEALEMDLEVVGAVVVNLWAASSAQDTDFVARLIDVCPDGFAHNLTDGIVRTRFRNGTSKPELLEPDVPVELTIDLWSIGHVFKAGHRIRLDVCSANFPRWDRNPNTGGAFGQSTVMEAAQQRIYHDSRHPTCVVLPLTSVRNQ